MSKSLDFLANIGHSAEIYNSAEIEEQKEDSPITLAIINKENKIQVGFKGNLSPNQISDLTQLAKTTRILGKTSDIKTQFTDSKNFILTFNIKPNEVGKGMIRLIEHGLKRLEERIQVYDLFIQTMQKKPYIFKKEPALGEWTKGNKYLRAKVKRELEQAYKFFESNLKIKKEEISYSKKKTQGIAFTRATLSKILTEKYRGKQGKIISLPNIGKILGGLNHATVILGARRFKGKGIEKINYNDPIPYLICQLTEFYTRKISITRFSTKSIVEKGKKQLLGEIIAGVINYKTYQETNNKN